MSHPTTVAPSAASAVAIAPPIPRDAPVTIATFPCSLFMSAPFGAPALLRGLGIMLGTEPLAGDRQNYVFVQRRDSGRYRRSTTGVIHGGRVNAASA
ncbi:hypothetical protein GCM10009847_09290 [Leucobacter tardus]